MKSSLVCLLFGAPNHGGGEAGQLVVLSAVFSIWVNVKDQPVLNVVLFTEEQAEKMTSRETSGSLLERLITGLMASVDSMAVLCTCICTLHLLEPRV